VNIREIVFGNFGFKMIALVGAIALWFFVTYRGQSETTIEANIDFKNVPAGFEILKQSIKRANVSVRGHEMILGGLRPSDVRVVVDLSSGRKGDSTYNFDVNDVKSRHNIKVKRIEPTSVKVFLDESVTKSFRIVPYVIGEPAPGYEVKKVNVEPASVIIEGAKTEMARMSTIRTEAVDISGADGPISHHTKLDSNGRNVRIRAPEALVQVIIVRKGK
jgi:YbbR domain-containing protein